MDIIEIKNLSFRYKDKFIFEDFSLFINRGSWVTIAGPNGAGKTTLVKLIAGLEKSYSTIKIFNMDVNKKNINKIRKEIGFCFDNPDSLLACETVEDELAFSLENIAIAPSTIKKKIDEISSLLGIKDLLKKNPFYLCGGQKQKVSLACALMLEPRILILDESLNMIDVNERKRLLKTLKEYCKQKRMTILSFTHDLDEAIHSDRLVVINEGKIIIDGAFPEIFNEENVMRKIGLEVPFEIEVSRKLALYDLMDELELDLKRLVDKLWK